MIIFKEKKNTYKRTTQNLGPIAKKSKITKNLICNKNKLR